MIRFINNFEQPLTQAMNASDGLLYLPSGSVSELINLFSGDSQSHQVAMTISDGTNIEIVYADLAWPDGSVGVWRAQEGTNSFDWPEGTMVSSRLTAGILAALPAMILGMIKTDGTTVLLDENGSGRVAMAGISTIVGNDGIEPA